MYHRYFFRAKIDFCSFFSIFQETKEERRARRRQQEDEEEPDEVDFDFAAGKQDGAPSEDTFYDEEDVIYLKNSLVFCTKYNFFTHFLPYL